MCVCEWGGGDFKKSSTKEGVKCSVQQVRGAFKKWFFERPAWGKGKVSESRGEREASAPGCPGLAIRIHSIVVQKSRRAAWWHQIPPFPPADSDPGPAAPEPLFSSGICRSPQSALFSIGSRSGAPSLPAARARERARAPSACPSPAREAARALASKWPSRSLGSRRARSS